MEIFFREGYALSESNSRILPTISINYFHEWGIFYKHAQILEYCLLLDRVYLFCFHDVLFVASLGEPLIRDPFANSLIIIEVLYILVRIHTQTLQMSDEYIFSQPPQMKILFEFENDNKSKKKILWYLSMFIHIYWHFMCIVQKFCSIFRV